MTTLTAEDADLFAAREELRATVRALLNKNAPDSRIREVMEGPSGWDKPLWQLMAGQLGVGALAIPEEFGGSGFGLTELGAVLEETGRSLVGGPLFSTTVLATSALKLAGQGTDKSELLGEIAEGSTALVVADLSSAPWAAGNLAVRAHRGGSSWRLTGDVPFVLDVAAADRVLVVADSDEGPGIFLVDGEELDWRPRSPMDLTRRLSAVEFRDAPAQLIGLPDHREWVAQLWWIAVAALAAEQVGGSQRVLEMCVDYCRDRLQFGRSIGSFQAIKHRIVDSFVLVESARSAAETALVAATRLDGDLPVAAATAGSWCSDTYVQVASDAIQIHGGIGFTWEHSAHLYLKRAKASQLMLGTPWAHRRALADALDFAATSNGGLGDKA